GHGSYQSGEHMRAPRAGSARAAGGRPKMRQLGLPGTAPVESAVSGSPAAEHCDAAPCRGQ
ncbi:MAG: hypothetical protein OEW19_08670, partial [Acidobacteriota bacterium]|nr:hypothetical protein [Acidobacteriota bacterium]